ncbi:MAG: peroxidase family protein, partial [Cyanobacteria bacterium J06635_11]
PVTRSEFVEGTGTGPNNPREYHNEITHWIDLSNVYGSDTERANELRSFSQGLLRTGAGNLLPLAENGGNDNPGPTAANDLFLAGDPRANENVVLSSMHTLFMREHNRLAGALAAEHPTWNDEQLYQRARQINIAQWQNIVYNEYLPTLLGEGQVQDYSGYDATIDPRISRTFSTAAYRFGHTQLSSEIERVDIDGNTLPEGNLSLFESFFPGYTMLESTGIDPVIRGVAASLSQEVDVKLISDVRNLLFNFGNFSSAQDLLALNLQRGRDHGLADYNSIRESFGLAKVNSFADITSNVETQQALASVYDDVNNIDAFIGMLAEDRLPGGSVGETITTVLVDQFTRLQSGDRFYYENIFTPEEIALIEETQLSDIILRNTDTPSIQENVFILAEEPPSEPIKTQLVGTDNGDVLAGTAGDDAIMANGGNDTVMAGDGNDDVWTTDATNRGAGEVDYVDLGSGKNKIFLGDTTGSYYTSDGWNDSVYVD